MDEKEFDDTYKNDMRRLVNFQSIFLKTFLSSKFLKCGMNFYNIVNAHNRTCVHLLNCGGDFIFLIP